jgi:hypothetical protein
MLSLLNAFRSVAVTQATSSCVSDLGLDEKNLEASVSELLDSPHRTKAALALTGERAREFLDILQTVGSGGQGIADLIVYCRLLMRLRINHYLYQHEHALENFLSAQACCLSLCSFAISRRSGIVM